MTVHIIHTSGTKVNVLGQFYLQFSELLQNKKRECSPRTSRGTALPFVLFRSVEKQTFFPAHSRLQGGMGNHKGLLMKSRYRRKNCRFSTLIRTVFGSLGEVTGADNDFGLRTLLALVGAGPAERIILPSAVAAQEETPLHPPFFAATHKSPCSGTPRSERFPSGVGCLAHSFFAASSRSRMEDFPWDSSRRPLLITPSIIP